jgi:hypothetical protein
VNGAANSGRECAQRSPESATVENEGARFTELKGLGNNRASLIPTSTDLAMAMSGHAHDALVGSKFLDLDLPEGFARHIRAVTERVLRGESVKDESVEEPACTIAKSTACSAASCGMIHPAWLTPQSP